MDVVMNPVTQLVVTQQRPVVPLPDSLGRDLRTDAVYVLYTSTEETFMALRVANGFAAALSVPLILIHYRTVPYPLAVDRPTGISPIEAEAFQERLQAEHLSVDCRVILCRDERRTIAKAFNRPSLIIVGRTRRWWPVRSRVERWRRCLESAGHFVVMAQEASHA
jgi:hypothetical protein